jgi:hypothetical protein
MAGWYPRWSALVKRRVCGPSSARLDALREHHSFRILSRPSSPARATPKHIPEATRPKISAPCNASMRGLLRLENSGISPNSNRIKPTIRLRFCMRSTHAHISPICGQSSLIYIRSRPVNTGKGPPRTTSSAGDIHSADPRIHTFLRILVKRMAIPFH